MRAETFGDLPGVVGQELPCNRSLLYVRYLRVDVALVVSVVEDSFVACSLGAPPHLLLAGTQQPVFVVGSGGDAGRGGGDASGGDGGGNSVIGSGGRGANGAGCCGPGNAAWRGITQA